MDSMDGYLPVPRNRREWNVWDPSFSGRSTRGTAPIVRRLRVSHKGRGATRASREQGSGLPQQVAQHRPVASRLVLAVAADREIGPVRQDGQQLDRVGGGGRPHL